MAFLTTDEFYAMTGKTDSDIGEDMLEALIEAASGMAEMKLGRKLALGDYAQRRFHAGRTALLEAYPVESVTAVRLDGVALDQWQLDAENGILRLPWNVEGLLEVEYTGGLEEIPIAVKQACALIALSLNTSIENSGQMLMSERLSDYQMMYYQQQNGSASISPAADALLLPWKNRRIAG